MKIISSSVNSVPSVRNFFYMAVRLRRRYVRGSVLPHFIAPLRSATASPPLPALPQFFYKKHLFAID